MALIIVESPTKARTFNRILKQKKKDGKYYVFATMGHIRDLPPSTIAVDAAHSFEPDYRIIKKKQAVVKELKSLAKTHKEIIFATDPDREGESIAYHAAFILGYMQEKWPDISVNKGKSVKRIVFHEITPSALEHALSAPETIRLNLVQAQRARRILDRLVGYELSPLLWKKIGKNWLSAGRVQTIALRLVVEREKEIQAFKQDPFYKVFGKFHNGEEILAQLTKKNGVPYEKKHKLNLFAGTYTYTKSSLTKANIDKVTSDILADAYTIESVRETTQKRTPPPPLTTSLLQQEAFQKYGYSSKMTMKLAQDLYERGLITYHRTDSFMLSEQFTTQAKSYITKTFGPKYARSTPRIYKTKSKLAQEAHEAIRPTKLSAGADSIKAEGISTTHQRIYQLIFARAIASQMKEALISSISITIQGKKGYTFVTDLQKVVFDGFLSVLNPDFVAKTQASTVLKEGDSITLKSLDSRETATKPPPRYNEASIIRTLEEKGIGRPSTYAAIISLIQEKNYVEKENRYFIPTQLGTAISDYLSSAFPDLFTLTFTAQMEENLDNVASQKQDIVALLRTFHTPFAKIIAKRRDDKKKIDVEEKLDESCPKCSSTLVVRYSRYGKFIACSSFPKCRFTKPFLHVVEDRTCPECGEGRIVIRYTKSRKRFFGCERYPQCTFSAWKLS